MTVGRRWRSLSESDDDPRSTRSSGPTTSPSTDSYRDLQQQGPIKVQLPYGEPCWLATRYDDVKLVYGDKRFGKEIGIGKDTPRMWETRIDDPTIMANMDPPKQTRIRRLALVAFAAPKIRDDARGGAGGRRPLPRRFEAARQPSDFVATAGVERAAERAERDPRRARRGHPEVPGLGRPA